MQGGSREVVEYVQLPSPALMTTKPSASDGSRTLLGRLARVLHTKLATWPGCAHGCESCGSSTRKFEPCIMSVCFLPEVPAVHVRLQQGVCTLCAYACVPSWHNVSIRGPYGE